MAENRNSLTPCFFSRANGNAVRQRSHVLKIGWKCISQAVPRIAVCVVYYMTVYCLWSLGSKEAARREKRKATESKRF